MANHRSTGFPACVFSRGTGFPACVSFLTAFALCLIPAPLGADLKPALAEPNLEKRSKLALDNAAAVYQESRAAYQKGDNDRVVSAIAEVLESVDLAYKSLTDTGKNPRKSPKWFKRAEIETRDLLRKLESFEQEMSFSERPMLEKLKARVQEVHDDLLLGLMEGRKK
ncbi:conserved exported hypothetical protein [Candidatus Sulfopaludibacter sp. SbA4]|nr:conserved exported hypothetical protein [Candidatus Sulfopaludibacter sp. SbA4]